MGPKSSRRASSRPGAAGGRVEPADWAITLALIVGAIAVVVAVVLMPLDLVHGQGTPWLVSGELLGVVGVLAYGLRHSSMPRSIPLSIALILAIVWALTPRTDRPRWAGIVVALLLFAAIIPWLRGAPSPNRRNRDA
jgi:hypothetical protein